MSGARAGRWQPGGVFATRTRHVVEEKLGLIGMDLVRLALERCRNRNEAVACITSRLEAHGQGGPGFAPGSASDHNSFNVAGARGRVFLETPGRHWGVREVQLDGLTNHLCSDAQWNGTSVGLEASRCDEGLWEDDGPVHVKPTLRDLDIPPRLSNGCLSRLKELLAQREGELDVAAADNLLRDHGEGHASPHAGAMLEHDDIFTLCVHDDPPGPTTASMVTTIPEDTNKPWPAWVSFAAPWRCVSSRRFGRRHPRHDGARMSVTRRHWRLTVAGI